MKRSNRFNFIARRRQEKAAEQARREETRALRQRLAEIHVAKINRLNKEIALAEERHALAVQRDNARKALRAALVAERDALQAALDEYQAQHKG